MKPTPTNDERLSIDSATPAEWDAASRSARTLPPGQNIEDAQRDLKATNPKDAIGSSKLALDLVPDTLAVFAAASFTEGATKYGGFNWRVAGVRASIYRAALERHLKKWWNGEDCDPLTKVPHLASVIACAGIILDADVCGKLNDDRPPKAPMAETIARMEAVSAHLKDMHKHLRPHHNTAKGAPGSAD